MSNGRPQCALASCQESICAGTAEVLYHLSKFDVRKCADCGIVFRDPFPDEDELRQIYEDPAYHASTYFAGDPSGKAGPEERLQEIVLNRLHDLLPRGERPRLLDVGCGSGRFLERARRHGFEVAGVEFSEALATRVRSELGIDVIRGEFTSTEIDRGPFHVVSMWDLLEHTLDPVAALLRARALLADGGLLLVLTIDYSSLFNVFADALWRISAGNFKRPLELLYDRRHNYYFDRRTLDRLLRAADFEVVERRSYRAHLGRWLADPPGPVMLAAGEVVDALSVVTGRLYRQLLLCRPHQGGRT
ncbi:MAG: class I SAM-dependent methyltransferase [Deltaproteobacteria bacterium]|nr:MAG: class I SAM-dependent methyltransferase [Deltaproteobacteria bacterium]